jgi:hypothetical protein
MRRALGLMVLVGCLTACEPNVDLVGSIEPIGTPLRLPTNGFLVSVGLVDGWVLVTMSFAAPSSAGWPEGSHDVVSHWMSPDGEWGPPIPMGRTRVPLPLVTWTRLDDGLAGVGWLIAPAEDGDPVSDTRSFEFFSLRRGATEFGCSTWPVLPVVDDPMQGTVGFLNPLHESLDPVPPLVVADGVVTALAAGIPAECPRPWSTGLNRILSSAFDPTTCSSSEEWSHWTNLCEPDVSDAWVGTMTAVELPGGNYGVLYRPTLAVGGELRWWVGRGADSPVPVRVGRVSPNTMGFAGQPRGASVGDDRVIFTEREMLYDDCQILRVMSLDGLDAHDAPWQLPCSRVGRGEPIGEAQPYRITERAELFRMPTSDAPASVMLIYQDLPNPSLPDAAPGAGRLIATLVTGEGRRGSELLDVAPAEAVVGNFFRAASTGDEAVVVYGDVAPGREGWWLQRLRYRPAARVGSS